MRQGDPLGPLIFAAAFQDTLEAAQASAPDALVVACHDDTHVQGYVESAVAAAEVVF